MRALAASIFVLVAACRTPDRAPPAASSAAPTPPMVPAIIAAHSAQAAPREPCAGVLAENRRRVEPFAETMTAGGWVGHEELARAIVTCVPAGRGAWTISVLTMAKAEYGERAFRGAWALTYVAPDGKVTRACDALPKRAAPGLCEGFEVGDRGGLTPIQIVASDLDGDGVAEVVITTRSCSDEGAGCHSEITVSAFHDGSIVRYAPASKLVPSDVEDFDHDGRLDLVVNAPWVAPFYDCFANEHLIEGPRLLAHARPDGRF